LESLPCGGCNYCTRACQQWERFSEDVDNVVPLAVKVINPEPGQTEEVLRVQYWCTNRWSFLWGKLGRDRNKGRDIVTTTWWCKLISIVPVARTTSYITWRTSELPGLEVILVVQKSVVLKRRGTFLCLARCSNQENLLTGSKDHARRNPCYEVSRGFGAEYHIAASQMFHTCHWPPAWMSTPHEHFFRWLRGLQNCRGQQCPTSWHIPSIT
jgi:hypothetical protein